MNNIIQMPDQTSNQMPNQMPNAQGTARSAPPKSFEVVYLKPEQLHFERRGDTLSLTLAGDDPAARRVYPRVALRSCFPVSHSQFYLSVRDVGNEEQPEIGIIRDWTTLAEPDRRAVGDELDLHYFVPKISRVDDVRDEFGFLYWDVDTDKGHKEFVMRNNVIRHAREITAGRWLLIDVNQARYEITNIGLLDRKSQKLIHRYLYL